MSDSSKEIKGEESGSIAGGGSISFDFGASSSLDALLSREWIETNGLGGFACSTLALANSRRYHALLVSSLPPYPVERVAMLSRLDETLRIDGESYPLSTRIYRDAVFPSGYIYLKKFKKKLFPHFYYEIPAKWGKILLKKEIAMVHGSNSVIVRYELLKSPRPAAMEIEPFVAARGYHCLTQANEAIERGCQYFDGGVIFTPYGGLPPLKIYTGAPFTLDPGWYYRFFYREERERGLDESEDLFRYGFFTVELEVNRPFYLVATTESAPLPPPEELLEREVKRRRALLSALPADGYAIESAALAADQFLVRRGEESLTVIAGYPWFTDWGRDAMISLPGLCLATGRYGEAKELLLSFGRLISEGMIPNRFPDSSQTAEYNTIDATLWYFVALYLYWKESGDEATACCLFPKLLDIVEWHKRGTRYGIVCDGDGLLLQRDKSHPLTWMDARVDGRAVTPRGGKAVEINALWYNALKITALFSGLMENSPLRDRLEERCEAVKRRFNELFFIEESGALFDVVDGGYRDPSMRPNQIIALSLPFEIVGEARGEKILHCAEKELLTPVGLRSLSPSDPSYCPRYSGGPKERDAAYHQGTVWGWLIGPYIRALLRYRKRGGREEAKALLDRFSREFTTAAVGTLSEIFDGDAPHAPKGCFAQAWSVAEFLHASLLLEREAEKG